ncbi:hypothetical protein [[Limnothrix rosea] IAM M-220]|uniref:hypothetical protein n=1 Tax=[Limnothrix rosea] IAM M-220 TaxID=454133 RepID=UPI0011159F85|nr:hypothetical protein [[Limnothrix rosea] IAM M-220]
MEAELRQEYDLSQLQVRRVGSQPRNIAGLWRSPNSHNLEKRGDRHQRDLYFLERLISKPHESLQLGHD